MIRTDPAWYLQKFWWTAVLFGGLFIFTVYCLNVRKAAKARKRAKAAAEEHPPKHGSVKIRPPD